MTDIDVRIRLVGMWSARAIVVIELVYIGVFVAGFAAIGNASDPLPDPYLAIGEVLILVMAPIMVLLMLSIHHLAPREAKPYTLVALGWTLTAAAFTMVVHFVGLTVGRHINPATFPGYRWIFGWKWPSTFYSIDIAAWNVSSPWLFCSRCRLSPVGATPSGRDEALLPAGLSA